MAEVTDRIIKSEALFEWLERAGVPIKNTRRVVIDATVNEAVRVYVEMYGSESMIRFEPPSDLTTNVRILNNGRS